ncbi:sigma-70 family RNA polymerase sigma factor [Anaerobacillus sp. HL2]|nr:sigma-70 family RNA polymerase sigma factor [Anaerobacillus sp. HL2]
MENNKGQTQIAEEYNVSVNTVKTWRRRAIEKIQQHLKMSEIL